MFILLNNDLLIPIEIIIIVLYCRIMETVEPFPLILKPPLPSVYDEKHFDHHPLC